MQTLADWVYGYVTQKRALTLIPGYHPRYPDTQVPPLSITEVERVESRTPPRRIHPCGRRTCVTSGISDCLHASYIVVAKVECVIGQIPNVRPRKLMKCDIGLETRERSPSMFLKSLNLGLVSPLVKKSATL